MDTNDMLKSLLKALQEIVDNPLELVAKTHNDFFLVITMLTPDEGYETCIFDKKNRSAPVERYKQKEEAKEGHLKWSRNILNAGEVIKVKKLGIKDHPEEKMIFLGNLKKV